MDFGYAGKLWDSATGALRKAWLFVMVPGYSRHQYCEVVFDQRTTTWLELHQRSFACFGGVPRYEYVPRNIFVAQHLGHAAKSPEGVLQTADERLERFAEGERDRPPTAKRHQELEQQVREELAGNPNAQR